MPTGRWPSKPEYGAYTAQFGAMNNCLSLLKDGGIIGINGPPGTGKTTLLSDIVADVTVQRAKKLIAANNLNLFMPGNKIYRETDYVIHFPVKSVVFEDLGIVVASNNNGAAENISKELPDRKKIDSAFSNADYLSEFSQDLIDNESWGLLAAALGNSENRSSFKKNFWYSWDTDTGFYSYLKTLYNNSETESQVISFRVAFEETKTELISLFKEFELFRNHAVKFHALLPAVLKDRDYKAKLEKSISGLKQEEKRFRLLEDNRQADLVLLKAKLSELRENIKLHQLAKPSLFFFQKLFNTKSFKRWNGPFQFYITELSNLTKDIAKSNKIITELEQKLKENQNDCKKLINRVKPLLKRLEVYQGLKDELHGDYGISYENIPDENLFDAFSFDKDKFHKSNPWSSVKINTLRSNIFLKSLTLQKYAIFCNARQFRSNINLLFEMLEGKAEVSNHIALSLWRTFFFCLPVVSTTLASVSRLFKSLDTDSIGWLLLDEAGQATPQSAVGIINRAKRSIIIGDPLQNEPVFITPQKLVNILNRSYNTEGIWSPLITSVQELTDRITQAGTLMESEAHDGIWTGFPLRTHRRCNDPMFSLANEIAYNNQMIKGFDDVSFDCKLGESVWFDVKGVTIVNKHAIVEEIALLESKLKQLVGNKHDVFVISPFRSVMEKCKTELEKLYPYVKFGTIHTFQGKEADIVFLILGSDPGKPGARVWASNKPNMLNVALTRAKRRFYVIGNIDLWRSYNYFDVIASRLEQKRIQLLE